MTKFREYKSCSCQQCHSGSRKRHKQHAHRQFRHAVKKAIARNVEHGNVITMIANYGDDWECGKVATKPMWY